MFATGALLNYIIRVARHFLVERNSFHSLTPYGSKESALSISSWDYSFTTLKLQDIEANKIQIPLVLNSTAFDLLPSPELEAILMSQTAPVRLQISLGAELTRHQALVFGLLKDGCGLDFLIDRPIPDASRAMIAELCQQFDIRLCVLVNRYFSTQETLRSLPKEVKDNIFLLLLPPLNSGSHFCAPDHVYRILSELEGTWRLLVFENALGQLPPGAEKNFYTHFDIENFLEDSKSIRTYHTFREVTVWLLQRRWIFFLDFLHSILLLVRNPSLAKFSQLLSILIRPLKNLMRAAKYFTWKLKMGGHAVYIFFRYRSLTQVYSFVRYECVNKGFYWSRERSVRVWHFCKYNLAIPFYYGIRGFGPQAWVFFRHRVFGLAKGFVVQIWMLIKFQLIHRIFIFFRYTAFGWIQIAWGQAWRLKEVLRVLLFPIFKVFWFFSYQFRTRVSPLFKNEVEDE